MKMLLILILICPQLLLARTIFEPNVSLNGGALDRTVNGVGTVKADYTSLQGGLRYGITREYIHVTVLAEGYYLNTSSDQLTTDAKFKTNLGIGVGYEWNIPIRTYITLGFPFSSAEVSYYYSEKMTIGLRYTQLKVEVGSSKLDVNTFGVAVSFPIEFDYPNYWWRKKDWQ
jgi:hypothetical protein